MHGPHNMPLSTCLAISSLPAQFCQGFLPRLTISRKHAKAYLKLATAIRQAPYNLAEAAEYLECLVTGRPWRWLALPATPAAAITARARPERALPVPALLPVLPGNMGPQPVRLQVARPAGRPARSRPAQSVVALQPSTRGPSTQPPRAGVRARGTATCWSPGRRKHTGT